MRPKALKPFAKKVFFEKKKRLMSLKMSFAAAGPKQSRGNEQKGPKLGDGIDLLRNFASLHLNPIPDDM